MTRDKVTVRLTVRQATVLEVVLYEQAIATENASYRRQCKQIRARIRAALSMAEAPRE